MIGGTVSNTYTGTTANAVYIYNASAKATITGGSITTAASTGNYAVNNTQEANAGNIKVNAACTAGYNNNNVTEQ
jgi:hypothetical protein